MLTPKKYVSWTNNANNFLKTQTNAYARKYQLAHLLSLYGTLPSAPRISLRTPRGAGFQTRRGFFWVGWQDSLTVVVVNSSKGSKLPSQPCKFAT